MKVTAAYFREKAELFRRLAGILSGHRDELTIQLHSIADEFDASADVMETQIVREVAHLSRDEETPQLH